MMEEEERKSFLQKDNSEVKNAFATFDEEPPIEVKYDGSKYNCESLDKLAAKDYGYALIRNEVEKCGKIIDTNDHNMGGFLRRSNRSFLELIAVLWALLLGIVYLEHQEWFPFKMKKNSNMLSDMSYALIACSVIVGMNAFYSVFVYKTKYSPKTIRLLQEYLAIKDKQVFSAHGFKVTLLHKSYNLLCCRKN